MLIGVDSSPCSLSLRNRSICSTTKCHQNKSDLKNIFVQKSFFFNIFYSFNPNHAYWNQRRLFSGNLPGMFDIPTPRCQRQKCIINCSQTKFVAIILVLSVFFNAIFRLTNFSSDAFDFLSPRTG